MVLVISLFVLYRMVEKTVTFPLDTLGRRMIPDLGCDFLVTCGVGRVTSVSIYFEGSLGVTIKVGLK